MPTCPANCTIEMQVFEHLFWTPIVLTTTYTQTVVILVDGSNTITSTQTAAIPKGEHLNHAYPTNAAGTATTTVKTLNGSTVLAYPTEFIDYPPGYPVTGTFNSSGQCYTDPSITWKSQDLAGLTQPAVSTPPGGDQFGTLYTVAGTPGVWPNGWLEARMQDTLPKDCAVISYAGASAVRGALLLTTTSISTVAGSEITPPPPLSKPNSSPAETTPLAILNPFRTSTPETSAPADPTNIFGAPVVVIGSTTVPVSAITPSRTGTPIQPPNPNQPKFSNQTGPPPQAVAIGPQTAFVGSTLTVGGLPVTVTTDPDAKLQIVYGTKTVKVPAAMNTDNGSGTDNGIGGYIMSGLSGPDLDSNPASNTRPADSKSSKAAGSKVDGGLQVDGVLYTLLIALLSFF
ncbi:hypothetical protein E6O75_ATG02132 [Venturia nashicola]|uniref:Uncharacterized protein n=1 Tax=Venturia nashicola TaxID=86259 RepID=A0A4Z1P5N2_9PEZI|nr:hypothetical protein E6O75_ATG02132 [Venturia nashicola]